MNRRWIWMCMVFPLWVNSKRYGQDIWSVQSGPDHDVLWSSRFSLQRSLILSVFMCCGWFNFYVGIWCCLSIHAFQEVLCSCMPVHHRSSFHICTSHPVASFTQTPPRWPPLCCCGWLAAWYGIIHFPQTGVESDSDCCFVSPFLFLFFAASGMLLSQISALKHTGSVQWAGKRAEQTVSVAIVSKTSLQTISVMKIKQRGEAHFHFLCSDKGRCLSWCGQYAFWWEPCDILLLCFTGKEKLFAALQNALWHLAWKQMQSVRDSSWRSSPKYQIRSVGSRGRKQHCVTISHNLSHEERSCPRQVVD